jgi:hypothetical protein
MEEGSGSSWRNLDELVDGLCNPRNTWKSCFASNSWHLWSVRRLFSFLFLFFRQLEVGTIKVFIAFCSNLKMTLHLIEKLIIFDSKGIYRRSLHAHQQWYAASFFFFFFPIKMMLGYHKCILKKKDKLGTRVIKLNILILF